MWILTALTGGIATFLIVRFCLDWCDCRIKELTRNPNSNQPIIAWRDYPATLLRSFNARPSSIERIDALQRNLILAGRGRPWTGEKYLAVSQAATILSAAVVFSMCLAAGAGMLTSIILPLIAAAACWWLASATVKSWIETRRKSVSREFPYFLDLSVMTMGAGGTFLEALNGYVRIARSATLIEEVRSLASEISMGTTTDAALAGLESRLPATEVVTVVRSIRQGLRMGTPLNVLFKEQAEQIRFKRSQLAERSAEELKVKLQGPTMLLMIAVLLLVLGPVIVGMTNSHVL